MGAVPVVDTLVDAGPGKIVPFASLDPAIDEMLAFIIVSSVDKTAKIDLVDYAVGIFDDVILPAIRHNLKDEALELFGVTYIDMYDLVECVGGNSLAETLAWASSVLTGDISGERPESLRSFAKCVEWPISHDDVADDLVASAVFYQVVASINIMLTSIAADL